MDTSIRPLAQFRGVLHYEVLQLWRTRVWLVCGILITALILVLANGISESPRWKDNHAVLANATAETRDMLAESAIAASITELVSVGLLLLLSALVLFPLLFADVIARDNQYGVRELWRSLPVDEGNYLAGKTIATMLIAAGTLLLCGILIWIMWATLIFPIPVPTFAVALGLPILPAALANTGLTVLICASQPTRRRAIMLAFLFVFSTLILLGLGSRFRINPLDYFNLGRPLSMRFYYTNFYDLSRLQVTDKTSETFIAIFDPVSPLQVVITGVLGFVQVGLVWWLIRFYRLRREV